MSVCIASATLAMGVAVNAFSLHWTHSVEKIEWSETWVIEGVDLVLQLASVRGSGAGMEPPEDAIYRDGRWEYLVPRRVRSLNLAVSGATVGGWQWCAAGHCEDLEAVFRQGSRSPYALHVLAGEHCRPLGP